MGRTRARHLSAEALHLQAKMFRGFSDSSRLALLHALRSGERRVSDLVEATGLSQPNVSSHLACLRECGLVVSRQEGRSVFYRLADERLRELLDLSGDLLSMHAARIFECTRYRA